MKMTKTALLLFIGVMTAFTALAQKADLRLNLKEGKTYEQYTKSEINIQQQIMGQSIDMVMVVEGSMDYLVKGVSGDHYDLEVKYNTLTMEMRLPQGNMTFSSESQNPQDIASQLLSMMKDKPFNVKMRKNGKVTEVKGIENLYAGMAERFPQIPKEQLEQLKKQLAQSYGEQAFIGNIEMVTAIFPDETVRKGDTWTVNTKLQSGMTADIKTVYEYTGKTDDAYNIVGRSVLETSDNQEYIESNGMMMRYDVKGTMNSDITVDSDSGWIREAKIKQDIKGDAHVKPSEQLPEGMTIPMTMQSNMTIKDN